METNDNNLKPQTTGGLKLMTVFIAVLALHVLVIGGFTVWHLLNPSNSDDVALDKSHKGSKTLSEGALPGDVASADTNLSSTTPPPATPEATETVSAIPADTITTTAASPAPSATAATSAPVSPAPASPAPAMVEAAPAPMAAGPSAQTPSGPIPAGPSGGVVERATPSTTATSEATASSSTPMDADASAPSTETPYVVKAGDSLARIAHRHHVGVSKLKTANSLTSDMLHIGQKLIIPARSPKMIGAAMPTETAATTPTDSHTHTTKAVSSSHHLYTVIKGDTIRKIAHRFKTTPKALMEANNLNSSVLLIVGEKLRIPSHEPHSAAASDPATAPAEPETKSSGKGQLANYAQ